MSNSEIIHIRINSELLDKVRKFAENDMRTLSQEIAYLLSMGIIQEQETRKSILRIIQEREEAK
jgi:hypothetical protein